MGYNIRMEENHMFEKVCKMLGEQLGIEPDSINPEQEVVKDLGADSLDVVELLMSLEDEYGITLPEGDVEGIKTVQDIVDMMERLQNKCIRQVGRRVSRRPTFF